MVSDYIIDIDLKLRSSFPRPIIINQYDRGIYLRVNLFDNGEPYIIPSTETLILELALPKGVGYIISGSSIKDISGNSFRVAIDRNISLNSGEASFNVSIVDKATGTTTRKGSFKNYIKILSNSIDENTVSSNLAVSIIETLQSNVAKATATETSLRGAMKDGDLSNYAKKTDVINGYVAKEEGKKLSTNDFTDAYKTILDGLTTTINNAILESDKKKYPIGHEIYTKNSANPSTYMGFGTWELTSVGRMQVGVDVNDTDFNVAGKTGGSKTHTNTVEELVPHKHKSMTLGIGNGGYKLEGGQAGAGQVGTETNYIGETTTVSLDETKSAQAQAFSIMPPYVTVYIWERTA